MKKIFLVFYITLLTTSFLFSQQLETIGAGVAEFLLSSPSTANKMNADQQIALSIIGKLLETAGQRKHEINVAKAQKTEINLSTNTGQQLQLVMDSNGNVFVLSNSIIYPISNNVVDEAKSYINQQPGYMDYVKTNSAPKAELMLSNYNITALEREWDKEKTTTLHSITSVKKPFYISDVEDIFEVKSEDIFIQILDKYYPLNPNEQIALLASIRIYYNKYVVNNKPLFIGNDNNIVCWNNPALNGGYHPVFVKLIDTHVRGTFTSKWYNDENSNGMFEFDEFTDLRRNFYVNEPFLITAGLYSQYSYKIKISILNQLSGEIVFTDLLDNPDKKTYGGYFSFKSNSFKPGIYVYNISFIRSKTNEELQKLTDTFQIIALNKTNDVQTENPIINTKSDETSSKTKMINDLIQLLKEGKISEETFKESMKALENK
jgi:hypothetical protein